jgi:hypothetical protein
MAARRVWETLSEKYRARLVKGGISKSRYEAGESLKAARGHKATPENRGELKRHPEKFGQYRERDAERQREKRALVTRVVAKKKEAFASTVRWNEEASRDFVRNPKFMAKKIGLDVKPATVGQLRQIDKMSVEEFIEFQYEMRQEDDWRALWYH